MFIQAIFVVPIENSQFTRILVASIYVGNNSTGIRSNKVENFQ